MVAHVFSAIIRADFVIDHGLIIDVKERCLFDVTTYLFVKGIAAPETTDLALSCAKVSNELFAALLR